VKIRQLAPRVEEVDLDGLLAELRSRACLPPFSPEVLEFCTAFSQALFKDAEARRFPELQALAFRMRKAELVRLRQDFDRLESPHVLLAPRGLVFHLPPTNVDTVFIYSWLMAVVTGNQNVIRLSARAPEQTGVICRLFRETQSAAGGAVAANTAIVQYGHEREITAALSAACDVRIIWGGDASVEAVRSVPLPPHGKELTFPDRYSFAVVNADPYLALDTAGRVSLAEAFFNDTYWFDQMACSSPRLVIWCGSPEASSACAESFWQHLREHLGRKGYEVETGTRLNQFTFACRAVLDQGVSGYQHLADGLTLLRLEQLDTVTREHPGGGLLFQYTAPSLAGIAGFVRRRDQTVCAFGFAHDELRAFARLVNGRGVDRIVPVGQALTFDYHWDGYNLLQELTRHVYIGG
jgi:hypothetical protein